MRKNELRYDEIQDAHTIGTIKTIRVDTALESFCADRERKGTRKSTISYYRHEINALFRFMVREYNELLPLHEVTTEFLNDYVKYLRYERGNKDGGINAKIRAIRTFLNYCEEVGMIKYNPAHEWKQIKTREPEINAFTARQIKKLIMQADVRKFTGLRNRVLMMFLLDTGVRVGEALAVCIDDIHFDERRCYIRETKSNFPRYVPMSDELISHLKHFLKVHNGMSEYVFVNLKGNPISVSSFRHILNDYGERAGITGVRCSPHTFRHSFAKFYIINGGDSFSLMQIMGHTTTDMTRRYVRLFSTEIVEKHRRYSPLANL